ncbi:hypothetical protein Bhyg_10538 [Pseudolycoriella hygida]|uniref:Uncharacterized protein n=1 Tax=Pseudolycoriella hygida TaxID=35572 RepID=A0A9Q0MTM8_9DIPT|nr:hypothetical protein Bhyg_10538 [Pseudolycoriella hygida]
MPDNQQFHLIPSKQSVRTLESAMMSRSASDNNEKLNQIKPENIIKQLENGHALVMLKRTRVKGFCVECIKKSGDIAYKKKMTKIITYCPKCPGGNWICASCFDHLHNCEEYLLP